MVRASLTQSSLSLETVYDRRAMLAEMQQDPLSLALSGVLILGTITTLLLALVGSLLASALYARSRLLSFAVLRALGSTPRQIISILTWEQGIVYCAALAMGGVFGALLVLTVVPALAFTDPILPGTRHQQHRILCDSARAAGADCLAADAAAGAGHPGRRLCPGAGADHLDDRKTTAEPNPAAQCGLKPSISRFWPSSFHQRRTSTRVE